MHAWSLASGLRDPRGDDEDGIRVKNVGYQYSTRANLGTAVWKDTAVHYSWADGVLSRLLQAEKMRIYIYIYFFFVASCTCDRRPHFYSLPARGTSFCREYFMYILLEGAPEKEKTTPHPQRSEWATNLSAVTTYSTTVTNSDHRTKL